MNSIEETLPLIYGESVSADIIRTYKWHEHPLGPIKSWPKSLLTTVNIILNSRFPMFLWWGDDLFQFYNDAYRPSLGDEGKHPAIGQTAEECWPEIWPVIHPLIQQVKETGVPTWSKNQLVPILRNRSVEDVYWTFGYSAVYNDDKIEGVLVVCIETTQEVLNTKKLEDQKRQIESALIAAENTEILLEEKVHSRTIELQKMNNELENFAYVASHDLQEPLRKIHTYADRIRMKEIENLSDTGKEYFRRLQLASARMQTLISDLLDYSRTNNSDLKTQDTNLNDLLNEVVNEIKEVINEKHAVIETGKLHEVKVVPYQFRQIIQNLIGNSLKFSRPGVPPYIKIHSQILTGSEIKNENLIPAKRYCHLCFSDNGIGFDPQYRVRIFDMFKRLNGRSEFEGTGIGLAIVNKIVENHKGLIKANGELGKGATFDIYIPN
ncbi:MAG: ATP-binding protein [Ferruginibacter sp.]